MKRVKVLSALLCMVMSMSLLLASCGGSSSSAGNKGSSSGTSSAAQSSGGTEVWEQTYEADGKTYPAMTIKQGTIGNMSDIAATPGCQGFAAFKNFMEGRSGGKIKVEIYDNSVLGGDEAMLEQVAQNSLQITTPMVGGLLSYNEEFGAVELPFLFASSDQAISAMEGAVGDYYKNALDPSTGLAIAGYYYNGARSMTNNKHPITCVDDCKGLKMRVMNSDVYIKLMEALGANPTPISWGELYTAMQQGTVDGQENPPSTIYPSGFAEVQKYFSQTEHVYGYAAIVVNSEFYHGMDADTRALFDEGIELLVSIANEAELELGEAYIAKMAEAGMECNTIDPDKKQEFIDATASVRDSYRSVYSSELWAVLDAATAN